MDKPGKPLLAGGADAGTDDADGDILPLVRFVRKRRLCDHGPRHVHVYRGGRLVLKWDLDNEKAMEGKPTRRLLDLIRESEDGGAIVKIRSVSSKRATQGV